MSVRLLPKPLSKTTWRDERGVHLALVEPSRDQSRSRRKRKVRARTVSMKRMTLRELRAGKALADAQLEELGPVAHPVTRGDCQGGERPCPFVSCVHHLYLDVSAKTGAIKLNFPDIEVDALDKMPATCALDVADRGGETLEHVGDLMNMTRERVRQYEQKCYAKIRHRLKVHNDERKTEQEKGLPREHSEISRDLGPSHQDARDAFGAFDDFWPRTEVSDV